MQIRNFRELIMIVEGRMDAEDWKSYVEQVSSVQGYALDAAQLERVSAQMALVAQVAQPLLALQLAVEVEPAPVYRP